MQATRIGNTGKKGRGMSEIISKQKKSTTAIDGLIRYTRVSKSTTISCETVHAVRLQMCVLFDLDSTAEECLLAVAAVPQDEAGVVICPTQDLSPCVSGCEHHHRDPETICSASSKVQ